MDDRRDTPALEQVDQHIFVLGQRRATAQPQSSAQHRFGQAEQAVDGGQQLRSAMAAHAHVKLDQHGLPRAPGSPPAPHGVEEEIKRGRALARDR